MSPLRQSRSLLIAAYLALVATVAGAVWAYGYRQALDQVAARGQADLALAADRLVTQLVRYRDLAVLLADHPTFAALLDGGDPAEAATLLLRSVDKTAALTAYYADATGRVLADARDAPHSGLVRTPYFRRAMQGALGSAQGIAAEDGRRVYAFAAPTFGADGPVIGALVVMVDIERLERDWRGMRPTVFFSDDRGMVFISNRSELLDWRRDGAGFVLPVGGRSDLTISRSGGHEIWRQDLSPYVPARALHLEAPLPVIGLTAEALVDVSPAARLAGLQAAAVAALCLVFGAALLIATERRRTLAEANAVLEERVATRTRALEASNTALRREVTERQEAEAALKRAQDDLVQAGKLSALGQMSAGISHELNQPLMAIRSFAENGVAFLERGKPERAADNLSRISDMAHRMGRIIGNLRAFARQESAKAGRVDLRAVLDSAVELTEARLRGAGVTLDYARPKAPLFVRGGEVRLGQVFVNLISNAVEAMAGSEERRLEIFLTDAPLAVSVRDTGPGIAEPERIFEPFYSTKTVGTSDDGMGLGLSISYGLVQSFGGTIRGANAPGGGAVFTVELEPWVDEAAA